MQCKAKNCLLEQIIITTDTDCYCRYDLSHRVNSHFPWSCSRGLEPLLLLYSYIQRCLWCSPLPTVPMSSAVPTVHRGSYKSYNKHIPLTTIICSNPITSRSPTTVPERITVSVTIRYSPFLPTSKIPNKLNTHEPTKLSSNEKVSDLYCGCSRDPDHPDWKFSWFSSINPGKWDNTTS